MLPNEHLECLPARPSLVGAPDEFYGTYNPGDERFAELIEALQVESERFCEWWSRYNVEQALTGKITVRHPDVGIIHIDVIETKFPAHPGLTMSVHVPARASDQDRIARLV